MPLFGKSLFETVLDGLEPGAVEESQERPFELVPRNSSLAASLVTALRSTTDERDGAGASLYDVDDLNDFDPMPVVPDWIGRISAADVAEDLGSLSGLMEAQLRERRRSFARLNHPDRVAVEYRSEATVRMTLANQLLDQALEALRG